jgi:steroid 5-alpha reductase family enzyme
MNAPALFLIATLLMLTVFGALFFVCVKIKNYGFVDVAWSYGFAVVALLFAWLGSGFSARKLLVAAMVTLWSLRLGTYLFVRVLGHHPVEDGRYQALRESWKENLALKFFAFFEFQALLVVAFSVPFLLACMNPSPRIAPVEWLGVALWCVAIAGESTADRQMKRFKADPANKGKVCQAGLWHCSRHPNYFFESLVWWAYFLFALGSPFGWTTVFCPLLMLWFLFRVTGIPLTEEQAVRSKGDAYREYQRTTSAFVPWFRKAPTTH